MVRFSAEKDGFFVSVYASHDCSLIAWNFSEQPSEDVFVGVSIERDGKKIHDQLVKVFIDIMGNFVSFFSEPKKKIGTFQFWGFHVDRHRFLSCFQCKCGWYRDKVCCV